MDVAGTSVRGTQTNPMPGTVAPLGMGLVNAFATGNASVSTGFAMPLDVAGRSADFTMRAAVLGARGGPAVASVSRPTSAKAEIDDVPRLGNLQAKENKKRSQIVHRAASRIGTHEQGRTNRSKGVDAFWDSASGPRLPNKARAWCAAFASWVYNKQHMPFVDRNGAVSTEQIRSWAMKRDVWHKARGSYQPKPGDLILFKESKDPTRNVDHVGIVEKYNPKTKKITTIEGNTSSAGGREGQGVHRLKHKMSAGYVKGFVNVFDYYKEHPGGPPHKK